MAFNDTKDRKLELLYKKLNASTTSTWNASIGAEFPSSSKPAVLADKVWTQVIPIPAPVIPDLIPTQVSGNWLNQKKSNTYSYIYKYEKVLLKARTNCTSYVYIDTDFASVGNIATTNLLLNAIPATYDPNGGYKPKVYSTATADENEIPQDSDTCPWVFDEDAGMLIFLASPAAIRASGIVTDAHPPKITFWKYTGETLSNATSVGNGSSSSSSSSSSTNDFNVAKRLFVSNDVSFNGNLYVSGDVSLNNRLFVNNIVKFSNNLEVVGNITLSSGGLITQFIE